MEKIIGILLALVLLISIASTPDSQVTATPAVPKSVIVEYHYTSKEVQTAIRKYAAQGYITKSVSNGGENAYIIIVLEKY